MENLFKNRLLIFLAPAVHVVDSNAPLKCDIIEQNNSSSKKPKHYMETNIDTKV